MRSVRQTAAVNAIELDLDAADDELVRAFAAIVRELALERRDMADPLTAIEADRRLGEQVPGGSVAYLPSQLFAPPVWSVYRNEVPDAAMSLANAGAPAS